MSIKSLYPDINPSLNLDFAKSKALDPRITFTRNSTATYVGSNGLIQDSRYGSPRFDHDPVTGESLGLLIEEQRTNLNTYSENLNSGYTIVRVITQYSASEVAPDGTTGTVTIVSSNSDVGGSRYIYPVTQNGAGTYTVSCFFKNQSTTIYFPQLRVFGIGDGQSYATFNLTGNGSITDSGGAIYENSTITPYSNNWYRCSMTFTTSGNSYLGGIVVSNSSTGELPNFDGSNSFDDGFLVWGFQNEAGSFPTSYIPTSGSTVTRTADSTSIIGGNYNSFINSSEGTILMDFIPDTVVTTNSIVLSFDNGSNYPWAIYRFTDDSWKWYNGNDSIVVLKTGFSNSLYKFGISFDQTNGSSAESGSLTYSNVTSLRMSTKYAASSRMGIGYNIPGGDYRFTGKISKLSYYPKKLTNAQLQLLTQ